MASIAENEATTQPAKIIISKKSRVKETEIFDYGCYPVQKIIGFYSGKEKTKYYRVQWAPSWIHEDYMINCEQLIEEFFVEQNIIKDLRGEPTKVKAEKTRAKDVTEKPASNNITAETVGVSSPFETSYYDSSDCEPLIIKKTLKENHAAGKKTPPSNKTFNSSYYDSSDNEPLIKKKLKVQGLDDCNAMNSTAEKETLNTTPKRSKPVTGARMSTNSSPSSKNNSPISKNTLSTSNKTPVTSPEVKVEEDDSEEETHYVRRYRTRQYYKEMPYYLRSGSQLTNSGEKARHHGRRKVYNTRQHVKHLTVSRKRGKNSLSHGTKKVPFSCKKMSPPRQKLIVTKTEEVLGSEGLSHSDTTVKVGSTTPENSRVICPMTPHRSQVICPTIPDRSQVICPTTPDRSQVICPTTPDRSQVICPTTPDRSQILMNIKKECSDFNKTELCPRDFSMLESLIPVVKQEPASPEDICSRFCKTWKTCFGDDDNEHALSNELLNDTSMNSCESEDKHRNSRDFNDLFSDESDVEDKRKLECDICEKMFRSSILLHRHRFIHCAKKSYRDKHTKPSKVDKENKENHDVGKWQVLSDPSELDLCSNLFSHHLRPRKENDTGNQ